MERILDSLKLLYRLANIDWAFHVFWLSYFMLVLGAAHYFIL
jgi:hypothetical protein